MNYCSRLLAVLLLCIIYNVTELIYDSIETMIDQIRTYDRWGHEKMTVFLNEIASTPARFGANFLHTTVVLTIFPISDLLLCLLMLAIGTLNSGTYGALTYFDPHSTAALKAHAIAEQIKIKADASKTVITYLEKP